MITIVVPCYNEETRVTPFLNKLLKVCTPGKYDIIIVNDGSTDSTEKVVDSMVKGRKNVRLVSYKRNMGKGHAVKTGVMASMGKYVIFIDADGSIDPDEIKNMEEFIEKYDVVVGTRASEKSVVKKQPLIRKALGTIFNSYVNIIFGIRIKDTLCGFKGFKKEIARNIFRDMKSNRWVFDVELFYKIRKNNYSLYQMPIYWVHKEDTKIGKLDPLKMFLDVLILRLKLIRKQSVFKKLSRN